MKLKFPHIILNKTKAMILSSIKVLVDHKILLYVVLVALVVFSWIVYTNDPTSSLASNFFTGFVELLITVIIVDALINLSEEKQKKEKYAALNKSSADGLKIQSMMSIYAVGRFVKHKVKDEEKTITYLESSNNELKSFVESILGSQEFTNLISSYEQNPKKTVANIRKLDKMIKLHVEAHEKTLDKIKPYPDPEVIERVFNFKINIHAHLQVVQEIYGAMLSAEKNTDDKKGMVLFKKLIWAPLIRGEIHENRGIGNIIEEYLLYCLYIHQRAEANDLEITI